jgi:hypothetical protein
MGGAWTGVDIARMGDQSGHERGREGFAAPWSQGTEHEAFFDEPVQFLRRGRIK